MATSIMHGKPGSYKSSSAVWTVLIPALKAGRFVVTNVEGLVSLEEMEQALGLKFPESAYLFRISTLNDKGVGLLSRWFHWAPVGSLILIDELQNLYNVKERGDFHHLDPDPDATTLDRINSFQTLPEPVKYLACESVRQICDDGYSDDLGLTERDSDGHIKYPSGLKDALMRHRKFNWDVVGCTPDIAHIHGLYRSVAEKAVSFKSFDFVPLPYFQRRPRQHEHNALEKGLRPQRGEAVKRVKLPLQVFGLYKSTQTGRNNKSGAQDNPFKNRGTVFKVLLIVSILFGFLGYGAMGVLSGQESEVGQSGSSVDTPGAQVFEVPATDTRTSVDVSDSDSGDSPINYVADYLKLMNIQSIWLTAHVERRDFKGVQVTDSGARPQIDRSFFYAFELTTANGVFTLSGSDLEGFGYSIKSVTDCLVELTFGSTMRPVFCAPTPVTGDFVQESDDETLSTSGLLGI